MSETFLQDRLTATKAMIIAYETAIEALITGVASYTLDTGQTKQTVTKLDIDKLQRMLDILYNRYTTLYTRLNGDGVVNFGGAW